MWWVYKWLFFWRLPMLALLGRVDRIIGLRAKVIWCDRELNVLKPVDVTYDKVKHKSVLPFVEYGSECNIAFEPLNDVPGDDNQAVMYYNPVIGENFNYVHAYSRNGLDQYYSHHVYSSNVVDPNTKRILWGGPGSWAYSKSYIIPVGVFDVLQSWISNPEHLKSYPYPDSSGTCDAIDRICRGFCVSNLSFFGIRERDPHHERRNKLPSRRLLDLVALRQIGSFRNDEWCADDEAIVSVPYSNSGKSEVSIACLRGGVGIVDGGIHWSDLTYLSFFRCLFSIYFLDDVDAKMHKVKYVQRVSGTNTNEGHACFYYRIECEPLIFIRVTKYVYIYFDSYSIFWTLTQIRGLDLEFKPGFPVGR